MSDHEHGVQENSLQIFAFYCGYLCQHAYYGLLQNPAMRKVVLSIILICFLLAVIINISFNIINEYYSSFV